MPTQRRLANAIRALAMDAVEAANSGHPGMPMGMADAATALFTRHLKHDPSDPAWPDRDRFVLSAGHGSMLIYALLHLTGYARPTIDDIRNFRQLSSPCAGHPENFMLDGIETTRALRAAGNDVPILVLTARDAVGDRVEGLDAGADDYLTKPFALEELLARLRALLRRVVHEDGDGEVLGFADLTMDVASRDVARGGRPIELTRTEFTLLELFLRRPRRVLDRSFILEEVWGYDFPTSANSLEVYVGYLRRKTEAEGEPRLIQTVRGVGYVLKEA